MNKKNKYSSCFSSPEKLANVVLAQYKDERGMLEFPINPFKILKSLDVKLVLKKFKELEGLYIPATEENDIDVVAINFDRPLYRQRFTAAHEICHCIKDKNNAIICPIDGKKTEIEKFADEFAARLLMPLKELKKQVELYVNNKGYIDLENVIFVSEYFGVSFESCVFNIAYKLNKIEGNIDSDILKERISKAKPKNLRKRFGIKNHLKLMREIVNFYCYARPKGNSATNIKFKQFLVLNENRLEGIDINEQKLKYILADLRLNNNFLKYSEDKNVLEALGNIEMLEYVLTTKEKIEVWKLHKLQRLLYKYTPYGNEVVFPRKSNNRISGSQVSTTEYSFILQELSNVENQLKELLNKIDKIELHEYILYAIKIHYKLTVIHPLEDGNGRCCRGFLIWLLRLKNIPPIYIKVEDKPRYLEKL